MDEQRITLDKAFTDWQGDMDQVDDGCVYNQLFIADSESFDLFLAYLILPERIDNRVPRA